MKRLVVGLLAHVDSGKTTLAEGLLYRAGVLRKLGRVDHRDAFLDTDSQERARGITIFAKQAVLTLPAADGADETELTLLDTPGHVDFSAEAERALQVLDYAVLVVSGTDGVQAHTETLWKLLARYRVPTFVFVNKMDLPGADAAVRLREIARLDALEKTLHRQVELLEQELRSTAQRVNLFEKVKIPEAKENIRVIGIYLGRRNLCIRMPFQFGSQCIAFGFRTAGKA